MIVKMSIIKQLARNVQNTCEFYQEIVTRTKTITGQKIGMCSVM